MTEILQRLVTAIEFVTAKRAEKSGKGYRLLCPAHNGKNHNLYVADGDKKLIVKCHSRQCDPKDIVEAAGLTLADIYYQRTPHSADDKRAHQAAKNERLIKQELVLELLVLIIWISDSWRELFTITEPTDLERARLAWRRVQAAADHFLKVGAK